MQVGIKRLPENISINLRNIDYYPFISSNLSTIHRVVSIIVDNVSYQILVPISSDGEKTNEKVKMIQATLNAENNSKKQKSWTREQSIRLLNGTKLYLLSKESNSICYKNWKKVMAYFNEDYSDDKWDMESLKYRFYVLKKTYIKKNPNFFNKSLTDLVDKILNSLHTEKDDLITKKPDLMTETFFK